MGERQSVGFTPSDASQPRIEDDGPLRVTDAGAGEPRVQRPFDWTPTTSQRKGAANLRAEVALAQATATLTRFEADLASARSALAYRKAETEAAKRDLDHVLMSRAWRLTAIPRRIAGRLPAPARHRLRRLVKAIWWLLTPWRVPARLAFIRQRDLAFASPSPRPATSSPAAVPTNTPTGPVNSSDPEYDQWISTYEDRQYSWATFAPSHDSDTWLSFLVVGDGEAVARTIESLKAQSSAGWRLIVAAEPGAGAADQRVRYVRPASALAGRAQLKALAERAEGDWIAVLDAGDVLASDAVAELAGFVAQHPRAALVYCDEDEIGSDRRRSKPFFKPSWSPQLLQGFNYFGRLTVLSRQLVEAAGGFRVEDGAGAEWSLNLRAADAAIASGRTVERLTRVLCHRAAGGDKERPAAQTPAAADHRGVLQRYWASKGFSASVETQPDGVQHATWPLEVPPRVSVIIPNHNNVALIERCLAGVLKTTRYGNLEVIIVENNSRNDETWAFYEQAARDPRVRVVRCDGPFNYSRVCNAGAAEASGQLLLFLNNDIEVVHPDWLAEMVRVAGLPEVGVVGTKLNYPNGVLQHAGVAVGPHLFGLMSNRCPEDVWGVFGAPSHPRNCMAIMGACQLVRREVFNRVGGFDETFRIANSDVVLCLQAHLAGWRTAYTPYAALVHHEGMTRGHSNPVEDMARSAAAVRRLGVTEDPYLHPDLGSLDISLSLRRPGEPSIAEMLQVNIDNTIGSVTFGPTPLDLFDDHAVLTACSLTAEEVFWPSEAPSRIIDVWAAARWTVDLLRRRADLRLRFPRALSDGAAGDFARWVADCGEAELGLGIEARRYIQEALGADLERRPLHLFFWSDDVRDAFPLALLPEGRRAFCGWLFRNGATDWDLRREEIWWFLLSIAEEPERQLALTYLVTPAWQAAHPDGLTVFGRRSFAAWLADSYAVSEAPWLDVSRWPDVLTPDQQVRLTYAARQAWRTSHPKAFESLETAKALIDWIAGSERVDPDASEALSEVLSADGLAHRLAAPGVNLIGHFCYPSGLKISLENIERGIMAAGGSVSRRNLRTHYNDIPEHGAFVGLEPYDVTLIHVQPEPFFAACYPRAQLTPRRPDPYRIAYWYWELDTVPKAWGETAETVDEVWAATRFVADALKPISTAPVKTLFPGVELTAFTPRAPEWFGLPGAGRFSFLFSFHMASVMERKNPLGLIEAFRRAFRSDQPVDLILKTTSDVGHRDNFEMLVAAAKGANVTILDRALSHADTLALTAACDAYVSLHRSEGLGLTMAEAMLLGKPVVATNYSGNLDFMDAENSLLVDYRMKPVGPGVPPYDPHCTWADPSVEHAAQLMRRLYENRDYARSLGAKAKLDAMASLSVEAAGRRIVARLAQIKASRDSTASPRLRRSGF